MSESLDNLVGLAERRDDVLGLGWFGCLMHWRVGRLGGFTG